VTAFVLYALVRQVSNQAAPHRNNERAALAAALLFASSSGCLRCGVSDPAHHSHGDLFGLLALNTYFDGLVTRKKAYFLFSALFYLLSAFSKEHAVLIPQRPWRSRHWPRPSRGRPGASLCCHFPCFCDSHFGGHQKPEQSWPGL